MNIQEALAAIEARRNGEFDHPALQQIGALSTEIADVLAIKHKCLIDYGFTVGDRDPRINTDFAGRYMVVDDFDEALLPTRDGRDGPWCVVGDDLTTLIEQGFDLVASY